MSSTRTSSPSIGRYLAAVREDAGLTQANLSSKVTLSTATLSRIESGDKSATGDDISLILKAIGTPKAERLSRFIEQDWDQLDRPAFDHPNRDALWEANVALRKLADLRDDPELKGVFVRQIDLYDSELRRLASFLASRDHQVACIGSIGVGKSTAICKLTDLLIDDEDKLDRQIVLETGAGGITLCEVHITQGPRFGIRLVPRQEDSIRKDVEDFADYLIKSTKTGEELKAKTDEEDDDPLGISKEVVRAIRNMAGLTEKRKVENGRRVRHDPAKDLAMRHPSSQELSIQILTRMDLLRRNRRDAWFPEDSDQTPTEWLQQIFADVNNGRHIEFSLPQKIEVIVPYHVFSSTELPIRVIDTKGIDQTAERQDLECHFDDPRTLVVLCSRFNDAPELSIQSLLHRAKESGVKDISQKTVLLVLPRPDEALAVKYDDGARVEDEVEGCELKGDQIQLRLDQKGLPHFSVEFFNAKEDDVEGLRERLIKKISEYREHYAQQISRISGSVDHLIDNRENEQVRLVFEHVSSDLTTWIDNNRVFDATDEGVQEPLISAIDGTRYASTVRAAVRRSGDWYNLDYFHHLAFGVRRLAVSQIGGKVDAFKVIVNNLIDNDDLSAAKDFLQRVIERLDAKTDEAYRRVQVAGRETFKQTLEEDHELWRNCEGRWGQGSGYRSAISNMTEDRFKSNYDDAHKLVMNLIVEEWETIVEVLEDMLKEKDSYEPAEAS